MQRPGYVLDRRSSVVREHPDNAGLSLWMLSHPLFRSGQTWYDALRKSNGTLTGGPAWAGGGRQGGSGALSFDGTNGQKVTFPSLSFPAATPWTLSFCARLTASEAHGAVMLGSDFADSSFVWLNRENDATKINVRTTVGSDIILTGPSVAYSAWRQFTFTSDGTALAAYLDGAPYASATPGVAIDLTLKAVGDWFSDGYDMVGQFDDLRAYPARQLSAASVAALFDQSRRGHPDTARWVSTRAWFAPAAGGAAAAPPYLTLLGVG